MKKLKLSFTALLCLIASTAFLQTFESIDVLSWSTQVGLNGLTSGGTTWDANGNAANDCDGDGFYGLQNGAFVINGWEGSCGCDCGPDDPSSNCGRNDSQMDILIAPGLIGSYCSVRIQIPVSASPTLECGTNDDQDPEDVSVDQCMEDLGAWAGTDFMIITYDVLKSDASREVVTERICGNNGTGLIERTFDDAQFIQLTIQGGTQEVDEFYEIGDIVIDGVLKELTALSIFAINHTNGFICENSSLPLILQTNADLNFDFIWTGPNGFISTDAIVQVPSLDPNMSGLYSVQVTDSNGCVVTGETNISVRSAVDAECTSSPEFNLFGIICSDQELPSVSDNGIPGSWSPGSDLDAYAGQTLEFTFQPTDPTVSAFQITLEVDDLDRLQDFAIQPDPTPLFCNVSSTRYDLIDIFQMNLDLSLTVNGEDDIFFFINNNETVQQVEAQMRSISFEGITPGIKSFFIDAVSPCGEFNQLSFNFIVLGDTDPIVIDTTLCIGEPFTYLGTPVTQDTLINSSECGGGIEINITREGPRQRTFPLVGSFCITDKVYVYDTVDMNGNQVGLTTDFYPEYEDAIDTIFSQSTNALYTLPFPASNGCDSLVQLIYTWPSSDNIEYKIFDLCANKDTLVQAGTREWLVSASNPFYEVRINCFSSVIIDANILPVEIDSIVSTFCADQDTLIEDFDGQMILFNKDNPSATFFADVGANGCSESKVIELTFIEPVTSEVNETICLGESVIVGNQVFTSTTINQEVVLSRQSSTGCDSIVVVNIEANDIPVDIDGPDELCPEQEARLSLSDSYVSYDWGIYGNDPTADITGPGEYMVQLIDEEGCQYLGSINIDNGDDCVYESVIEKAITPNGDGINDAFNVGIKNLAEQFPLNELLVFNRWGSVVYEAQPYDNDWTGQNNSSQELPEGTYYILFKLNARNNFEFRGSVTVIR